MSAPQNIQHFGPRYGEATAPVERHNAPTVARFPPRAVGLTRKQSELLEFIRFYFAEFGVAPSFDEMRECLELSSKSGVHRLIEGLVERGHIQRLPGRARAITICSPSIDLSAVPTVDILAELYRRGATNDHAEQHQT